MSTCHQKEGRMCPESAANDLAHEPGLSRNDITQRYTNWALSDKYEWDLRPEHYRGPKIAADTLAGLYPKDDTDRSEIRVLDVAAGTGFVADELRRKGFKQIDALEPSAGMIKKAKEKNLYTKIFQEYLCAEPTPVQSGTLKTDYYDVVVTAGGMGEGHIPCSGLDEMIRVAKPGGYVVIVMREAYLLSVEEYKDRLEPKMQHLERSSQWETVSRSVVPQYSFSNNGVVFVFKVKA